MSVTADGDQSVDSWMQHMDVSYTVHFEVL